MVSTMLSRAVVVLAALSAALSAEVPSDSHIMHVPRHGLGQQQGVPAAVPMPMPMSAAAFAAAEAAQDPADERVFKVGKVAVPLLAKFALKPKFPFGLKEKLPFGLKKKLPAFLGGGAAAAAGAAGAAGAGAAGAAGAAGGLGALGIHGLDFTKLGGDAALLHQYPIWKVHRYNGIDLRPVRLGAPAPGGPYPAAAPAGQYVEEPKQVYGPPPKEVAVPEPVYGPPAEAYGPPAETYGPPAQTYGPPAETYGPPAETYGPPTANAAAPGGASSGEDINESLETLSQLGALTDLLPGGGSGSGGPLSSLSNLGTFLSTSGRSKGEILSTLAKLKEGVPSFIKSAVSPAEAPAAPPAESAVYHPPAPSGIHGLLQGHPLISSIANGFRGNAAASHVPLPPLPELPTLPEIKGLKEIPGIPNLPHISLPTKYIAQGGPYVSVRYPTQQQQQVIAPRGQLQGQLPIPVSAAPAPVTTYTAPSAPVSAPAVEIPAAPASSMVPPIHPAETYAVPAQSAPASAVGPENAIQQVSVPQTSYTLPLEPQQPQQQQYIYSAPAATQVTASRGQVINSYGAPVSQETYTYTTSQQYAAPAQQQYAAPAQQQQFQYSAPVAQYSAPVTQYSAPVAQYTAQAQQYSAPVTQYVAPATQYAAPDAFTAASETQATSTDAQGRNQEQAGEQDAAEDERAEINENSRSDHIDAAIDASEPAEVRVAMPIGQTRAIGAAPKAPAAAPVFDREEQTRRMERLQEMRQMVDKMVDLSAYLDPAHPASTARDASSEPSVVEPTAAPADQSDATTVVNQDAVQA